MAKRFVVPFAATGDKTVTPDATDPGGAISYSQGWGAQYQLPNTDPAYRPVGRQEMNGVLNDVTGAIAELQQLGFPEWVPVSGLVTPYAIEAYVRHNNLVWRNTLANNSAEPGTDNTWANVISPRGVAVFGTPGVTPWIVPNGVTRIFVKVIGGGGGGGRRLVTPGQGAGGGAGGGGYSEGWITVTPGASINVTVGAGGAGSVVSNTPGANGSTSSFGAFITASGGLGGGTASGAAGGVGSGGQLNTSYGPGGHGLQYSSSSVVDEGISGPGGGPGGRGWFFTAASGSISGANAAGPGGGGGGAVFNGNGGNGGNGYIRVEW